MANSTIEQQILETLRPIIARLAQEDPSASEAGFFLDLFVGIGVGAGVTDGLSDQQITDRVMTCAKETLEEARK